MLIQICNSLRGSYLVNEFATMAEVFKEFAQQQMEDCSGFVFKDLRHFECFVASVSSERQVSLTSQTLSVSALAALIAYRI